jgi:hypothetical protein
MLDKNVYILKSTWRDVSAIQDTEFHVKSLMVVAFAATGDDIANYCLSGKRGSKPGQSSPKAKFPDQMLAIAKGTFFIK